LACQSMRWRDGIRVGLLIQLMFYVLSKTGTVPALN
jgi:hypothetical protein